MVIEILLFLITIPLIGKGAINHALDNEFMLGILYQRDNINEINAGE
jgi:hypothetical protein